jgi:hypothetical protein
MPAGEISNAGKRGNVLCGSDSLRYHDEEEANMRKFVGRTAQVEMAGDPPAPAVVTVGDRRWAIVRVEREWFDTGHGTLPARASTWRTRRHRKMYELLAAGGARLHLYLDYGRGDKRLWRLATVEEPDGSEQ